ncbi:immunoglobulin-like domain-containing protein [Sporolactobacillus sp. STCC-11]|uniref:immunoglobulin-like domain-containing protein n=1 Tax=Sporolactobacillus caesalpiniae TaxID=3230362 RepID=UPI003394EEFC
MKICIIAMAALLFLSGCHDAGQNGGQQHLKPSPYTKNSFKHVKGIRVYMDKRSYPARSKDVTLIIENNTDEGVTFGMDYTIEMKQKGKWYVMPFRKDGAFTAMAEQLNSHQIVRKKISLDLLSDQPEKGNYRVIKKIGAQPFRASFELH